VSMPASIAVRDSSSRSPSYSSMSAICSISCALGAIVSRVVCDIRCYQGHGLFVERVCVKAFFVFMPVYVCVCVRACVNACVCREVLTMMLACAAGRRYATPRRLSIRPRGGSWGAAGEGRQCAGEG
jgi:hypothetical protein